MRVCLEAENIDKGVREEEKRPFISQWGRAASGNKGTT